MHRAWRSVFIMQASESVISVCFNTSLLKYGGDIAVGAMTILTSVMQFAMLPLQGLAQGAQPILSYNYGAKSAGRVRKAFQLLLIASLVYSTLLWVQSRYSRVYSPQSLRRMKRSSSLRRKRFESTAACWCFSASRSPAR